MDVKLTLLSAFLLMILPNTFQSPISFRDPEDFDDEDERISFPRVGEAVDGSLNEEYLNDETDEDEVNYEDERALYKFISDLKKKGDNPSVGGAPTWKPDLESNNLWNFQSFLNELVTQSQKEKFPIRRIPEN